MTENAFRLKSVLFIYIWAIPVGWNGFVRVCVCVFVCMHEAWMDIVKILKGI